MAKGKSPLMRKRRFGPSAQSLLNAAMNAERCCGSMKNPEEKCENPVVTSLYRNGKTIRLCIEHFPDKNRRIVNPQIAREMWWAK